MSTNTSKKYKKNHKNKNKSPNNSVCIKKRKRKAKKRTPKKQRKNIKKKTSTKRPKSSTKPKKKTIPATRVIPVPEKKKGGFIPLIPLFAGLSALGALAGAGAGIAKTVNEAKANKNELMETKRHNQTMESIALGKGLYLKPHNKTGLGLFLKPSQTSKNYR